MPVVYPIMLTPTPPMSTSHKLFVNIRVNDLQKSMAFFAALGFTFNTQFTDDNAACLVVSDDAYFMLLTDGFFRGFTTKTPSDPTVVTEAMYAVSCDSRTDVDAMFHAAIDAGGSKVMPPQDHGFMYSQSFYDLDGHHWEVLWMDPATIQ